MFENLEPFGYYPDHPSIATMILDFGFYAIDLIDGVHVVHARWEEL